MDATLGKYKLAIKYLYTIELALYSIILNYNILIYIILLFHFFLTSLMKCTVGNTPHCTKMFLIIGSCILTASGCNTLPVKE